MNTVMELSQYAPWIVIVGMAVYFLYTNAKKGVSTPATVVAQPETKKEDPAEKPKEEKTLEVKDDTKDVEVKKATEALDDAGIKGTEYLQTLASVRHGFLTGDEVKKAHKKD